MPDSVLEAYERRFVPQGLHVASERNPLTSRVASLRAGPAIPPREWLYGTIMLRRYITVLIAPGGVGKTAWSIAAALSLAHGRALIGDYVHSQANVLCCNLEDPEDEFDRRIAAAMIHHKLDDEHLAGRIRTVNGRERRLVMASIDEDGLTIAYPDKDAMAKEIREHNIGAVFVDPFVNSHELEENSNPHINAAVRTWAEIAHDTGCAVVLIHHTRKGAIAGDADSGRGASAMIAACRSALTLTAMTPEEAGQFAIPERERRLHIRLDDAKANLAPPSEKARWFRLVGVNLGNATADYPNGDNVQAVEEWEPPNLWANHENIALNRALDQIAEGPEIGQRYCATKRGKTNTRWAGNVLVDLLAVTEEQAKIMIRTWLANGLLTEAPYRDPATRRDITGLWVCDDKRPSMTAPPELERD